MDSTHLTSLLNKLNGDDPAAFGRIAELVYDDFRGIAHNALQKQSLAPRASGGGSLGVTMLANDALMELRQQRDAFLNRHQFFALATRFMFRLISHSRRDGIALKRGGGVRPGQLSGNESVAATAYEHLDTDVTTLLDALAALHEEHAEAAEIVTLHVHGGLSLARVAELIGLPLRTVERRWSLARAFLAEWPTSGED